MPVRITPARSDRRASVLRGLGLALAVCVAAPGSLRGEPFDTIDATPSVLARDEASSHQPSFSTVTTPNSTMSAPGNSGSWLIDGGTGFNVADVAGCTSGCEGGRCQADGGHGEPRNCCPGDCCDAPGLMQYLGMLHHRSGACWSGRADALILWRNAPPGGRIVDNAAAPANGIRASTMDSEGAAGPRFSIFRVNNCTGHAIEATYLRAANFRSLRPLSELSVPYELAPPGIYGNPGLTFDTANADLGSRLQSFEFNRHHCITQCVRLLAGFRWVEWQEQFSMQANSLGGVSDYFQTNCMNDLYGGQIGLDANLLATSWIRFDSVLKAGAYYNNAVQSSLYTTNDPFNPGTAAVTVGKSPLSGAFVGEVGVTGVIPLTSCLDVRLGYFGLWLSGIAQPTQQLAHQQLTPGQPVAGTINANGGVVVQGLSVGLEGRW